MNSRHRVCRITSPLALGVLAVLACAGASAQNVADWDIPVQPLADALRTVAARTESNILFDRKLVAGQLTRPLKKQASADEVLQHLLEGTGLTYRHLDEKTVTIQPLSTREAGTTPTGANEAGGAGGRIRLAQADRPAAEPAARRDSAPRPAPSILELEEILVTGTQIRGIRNNTAPVNVLTRGYIESTGYSTTSKLVESLPQNFALTNQASITFIPGLADPKTQGSAINLRGISEGTTLVLLNGRRMAPGFLSTAVDLTALPLSAIEQVEVLTDGASALYGSDAVGGVVNFILRQDFEGIETQVRAGSADAVDEYRVRQALGNNWETGNAVLSGEYYKRDLLLAKDRDFVPTESLIRSLLPRDENYAGVLTARQNLSDQVSMFMDALYTNRDSFNLNGPSTLDQSFSTQNDQLTAALGIDWNLGQDWQIELSGNYSRNELEQYQSTLARVGGPRRDLDFHTLFEIRAAQLKADGTLFSLPGGNVRMAIGTDWRSEAYEDLQRLVATGIVNLSTDADQIVRSAFGEVYVPLVSEANQVAGIHRLELSLAGRYDDYSTFGSSFDPQVGLMWEPLGGLRLRGSHGTSYKAPNLVDHTYGLNSGAAFYNIDPGSPSGVSYQMEVAGVDVDSLGPQQSESTSVGLEFFPDSLKGLQVAVNYYRIRYTDRIGNPPGTLVQLSNPAAFPTTVIRDPSTELVEQYIALAQLGTRGFTAFDANFQPDPNFTPESVDVIIDHRRRNLSLVSTSGIDLASQYEFPIGTGTFYVGLSGTYILELEQQVTRSSEPFEVVDTIYNPPDWRLRGSTGWQSGNGAWAVSVFVNQTDSYTDNRISVALTEVDSYTTVDARVAYDFGATVGSGWLSGLKLSANVQNMLDEDPPHTTLRGDRRDSGFDPTNASPLGRLVSVELTKNW